MNVSFARRAVVASVLATMLVPIGVFAKPVSFKSQGQLTAISTRPAQLTVLVKSMNPKSLATLRSAEITVQLDRRTQYVNAKKKKIRIKDIPTYSQVSVDGQYDGKKFVASRVTLIKANGSVPKGEKIMDRIEGAVQSALSKSKPRKKAR